MIPLDSYLSLGFSFQNLLIFEFIRIRFEFSFWILERKEATDDRHSIQFNPPYNFCTMSDSPERTPEVPEVQVQVEEEHTPLLPTTMTMTMMTWQEPLANPSHDSSRPPPPPRPPRHARTRSETPSLPAPERKPAPGRRHHQRTRSLEEWANMFGIPGISGGEDDVTHERTDNQLSYQERRKRRLQRSGSNNSTGSGSTSATNSRPPLPPKG